MTIKLQCAKCTFKVEAELKKEASLLPDDLKNMAQFFGLEPSPEGYICEDCRKKQEVCHD